ncbi:MAG TPA: hypothetical protein VHG71_01195 [Verrucomicrobiae bacterium]|nr:hypothetical protein [Verrucomicrobiae bacterium]
MCCFSGHVKSVSATNIFARKSESDRQFVVYSMTIDMAKPLAMVLPIPVKKGSDEKAVRFIDLENYQNFFGDLDSGFPRPISRSDSMQNLGVEPESAHILEVVQVGNFEASFVPTVKDFSRLDERFRMPPDLFAKLPEYRHFGFAVFKLKPGAQTVHPMAFEFPTALEPQVFFPTVHVHDGKVHDRAKFDHVLYCQPSGETHLKLSAWAESPKIAKHFVDVKKSSGLVLADEHCYKREMRGLLPNKDTILEMLKNS